MKLEFNDNWSFVKQGEAKVSVCLPHDAMIGEKRAKDAPTKGAGAYFSGGVYEYEKQFDVPEEWREKCVSFEFEGVYRKAKVFLNGALAGEWAYGYTDFYVSADQYLQYGKTNTVKVVADNSEHPNSRWYTGSGIYRPVWLHVKNKTHIKNDGVFLTTLSLAPATVRVQTAVTDGEVSVQIFDGESCVASGEGCDCRLQIQNAKLWSADTPYLYTAKISLSKNGAECDTEEIPFGIRMLEWSTKGFFVNGEKTLLRGGCVHHDNGILGAACYKKAEERRVRIMKKEGFNALRSSHNPMSKAMIEACDRLGVYVIDETFDMWYLRKSKQDYALDFEKWYLKDVERMVMKDRNHPSVIMYSIANEVSEPYQKKGEEVAKSMIDYLHAADPTRPVTGGFNLMVIENASKGKGIYSEEGGLEMSKKKQKEKPTSSTLFNMITQMVGTAMNKRAASKRADEVSSPVLDMLDIVGYNYGAGRYEKDIVDHPKRVIFGSETFPQDIAKNWAAVERMPHLIGDFMWTAWDYLGEVGLGSWTTEKNIGFNFEKPYPWLLACAGAIDIIGTVGAEAKYASTVWGIEKQPYLGVRPCNHPGQKLTKMSWRGTNAIDSWSWESCEGNKVEIEVYSAAATAELVLNGKSLGKKKLKDSIAMFKTKYRKGKLEAIVYGNDGKECGRATLFSAKGQKCIRLTPEEDTVRSGEIVFVNVDIVGENGVVCSNSDCVLQASVKGGELLAFGSAVPKTEYNYLSGKFPAYYGKALAVVKATQTGNLQISVQSENGMTASTEIAVVR